MKRKLPGTWYVIKPFKKGFLGESAHGKVYGTDKSDVIKKLIELSFQGKDYPHKTLDTGTGIC